MPDLQVANRSEQVSASENSGENYLGLYSILQPILKRWRIVVAGTVLFALVGLLVGLLSSPSYEATALVLVRDSTTLFENRGTQFSANDLQQLATADALMRQVQRRVEDELPGIELDVSLLKEMLDVQLLQGQRLLSLSVTSHDPNLAETIASVWALQYEEYVSRVLIGVDREILRGQIGNAEERLGELEQELVVFGSENNLSSLQLQLNSQRELFAELQQQQNDLKLATQNLELLQSKLNQQAPDSSVSEADQVTAFALQLKIFDLLGASDRNLSIVQDDVTATHLQLPNDISAIQLQLPLGGETPAVAMQQQMFYLDALDDAVAEKAEMVDQQINELAGDIAELEARFGRLQTEHATIQREIELERTNYLELRQQLYLISGVEERVQMVDVASLPEAVPHSLSAVQSTVAGGLAGLALSALGTLVLEVLQTSRVRSTDSKRA